MKKLSMEARVRRYLEGKDCLCTERKGVTAYRHRESGRRFALLDGDAGTLTVRVGDPLLRDLLLHRPGCAPGVRGGLGWVGLSLDGTVDFEELCERIDGSMLETASPAERQALRPPKAWLVPANPKYYDVEHAFEDTDTILWKQGSGIRIGDTVFMYTAAPVSAILYRCLVLETDIPCDDRGELHIRSLMRIRLERSYDPSEFPFSALRDEYGIFAVRGPRGVPPDLRRALTETE